MPDSAQSVARDLYSSAQFAGEGEIEYQGQVSRGRVEITAEGICIQAVSDSEIEIASWEIVGIERAGYTITLPLRNGETVLLRQFARRTDELEVALWRCRCDGIARLMAPPAASVLEAVPVEGTNPGWLYRYEDGLRWVPTQGAPFARLYGELAEAEFDQGTYGLALRGPFGEHRLQGLARRTTELQHEVTTRIALARDAFVENLEQSGIPWQDEVYSGAISEHVPFEPTEKRVEAIEHAPDLIAEGRREYWQALHAAGLLQRMVLSSGDDRRLRAVALAPVRDGELYEVLSEEDHASYVFQQADPVVQAWTQVGFRREPIFAEQASEGPYAALADLLPALANARAAFVRRVVHSSVDAWLGTLR